MFNVARILRTSNICLYNTRCFIICQGEFRSKTTASRSATKMRREGAPALGDRNAGIRERYFTYAMTSPNAAFGRVFNLNAKHFTKLKSDKPGLAVTLDKKLQELCKDIDINQFPAVFTLEEQGQFAIGYYHQRQKQFSSSAKN